MAKIAPKGKKVTGTKKNDKITWVSQKPWKKNLTVKAGSGNDVVNFKKSKYKNTIYGDKGNDKILGGKSVDKIYGGAGNDKLYGYNGNDIIKAGSGTDYIDGGAGNDKIYGESGTNTLKGGAGNDYIYAGSGTDKIYGGAGTDIIYANKGVNNVYINKGEGNDKIRGVETSSKLNLNLGTGLQRVIVYKNGANYVVERKYSEEYSEFTTLENFNYDAAKDKVSVIYNGKTVALSSLYIPNYDPATSTIKDLGDEGGSYTAASSGKNQIVYGGAGNDTIRTKESDDYINAGEGNNGITIDGGSNTVITGSGDDTININGGDGPNVIEAGDGDNTILSNGSSTITAGAGDDLVTVQGGTAESESYIDVGAGKNAVQMYSLGVSTITGSGDDTIAVWAGGTNVINTGNGEDYIYINEGTNTIDLTNADGTHLTVYDGNSHNTVYGGAGNNTYNFQGGSTNLTVDDHEGQSAYSIGGGSVTISGNGDDVDKVTITGGTNHNITTGGGEDTITIDYAAGSVIDTGADADRVTISSGASNTTVDAGKGNDSITANGSGNILYGGQGQDTINANSANGNSTIYGGNDSLGADTGYNVINAANGYNNVIYAGNGVTSVSGGESYIKGDSIWAGYNGNGDNTIYGGNGNDYIQADGSSEASVTGGKGSDTIYSGSYRSTVDGGEGNDTIYVYSSSYGSIRGGDGNDYISSPYGSGASGSADIWGDKGNDTISVSYGSYSANIHFKKGDGSDTIDGGYNKTEAHTLVFDDVNADDITTYVSSGGDLTITYNNGQDHIYVEDYANYSSSTPNNSVAYIKTADMDSSMSLKDFVNERSIYTMTEAGTHYGTYFYDNITGTSNSDTIYGRYGDDTLNGAGGNDTLDGEYGNDSLLGGDGDDYISDYNGRNTIIGGKGNDSIYGYNAEEEYQDRNSMIFNQGDGVDTITNADDYNTLLFDVNDLNNIAIEYDIENRAVTLRYSENDRVVLAQNSNTSSGGTSHDEYNVYIGKKSDPGNTRTLSSIMQTRHLYMPTKESNNNVVGSSNNDSIYVADSWLNTITGGSGNDTITLIGRTYDSGRFMDIGYVDYIFDSDGDGHDVLENTNVNGYASIVFKYVGYDKDDIESQKEFLDGLVCTINHNSETNTDDLVITYGTDSSITIKNYNPENPQSTLNYFQFVYYNSESGKYDIFSDSYSFDNYMHITRNADGSETSIQGANYNELIYGSTNGDTINPGLGDNIVKPKSGADTIEITIPRDENGDYMWVYEGQLASTENTLYMGTDDVPDTIWFKDVVEPNVEISVQKSGDDLCILASHKYYVEDYDYYTTSTYSYVYLKDYFTYVDLDDPEPTYMNIKLGNGEGEANNLTIRDLYYTSYYNYDAEVPKTSIDGTLLPDSVWTSPDVAEYIQTGAGNDTVNAYSDYEDPKADTIWAGTGDDFVDYGINNGNSGVRIYGEEGNDTIYISEGAAYGGAGNDSIEVQSYTKDDDSESFATIYGGTGTDSLDSELDEDTLEGGYGNDYIYGSKGKDSISGWGGNDYIDGGANDDTILGGRGANTIYGGTGVDLIYTSDSISSVTDGVYGNDGEIYGGDGDDTIYISGTGANVWGDDGDDLFISTQYSSSTYHVKKNEGNDTIVASRYGDKDKIKFDDLDFTTDDVTAEFDLVNNQMIIKYNKVGDEYQNTITLDHYFNEKGGQDVLDEEGNYTYDKYGFQVKEGYTFEYNSDDDVYCSIDTLIDKNGKELSLKSLIKMPQVTPTAGQYSSNVTTVFSDNLVLDSSSESYFYLYSGDDTIVTSDGRYSYSIDGGDGNDSMTGNTQNDYFDGGNGNDYLDGKGGKNSLNGGDGNDTLVSGTGKTYTDNADTLVGGEGANLYDMKYVSGTRTQTAHVADIYSISGDDTINVAGIAKNSIGSGSDDAEFILYKGSDDDLIVRYSPQLNRAAENFVEVKNWFINPTDMKITFKGANEMSMVSAVRTYWSNDWSDITAKNVSGNTVITSSNQSSYIADMLFGTNSADTISFDSSYDGDAKTVYGFGGNDVIDISTNNMGSSTVYGGDGNDTINAHGCTHTGFYDGGDGNDSITGGAGNDTIFGGAGADTIDANSGYGHVIFTGTRSIKDYGIYDEDIDSVVNKAEGNYWSNYFNQLEQAGDITNYVTCAYGRTSADDENKIFSIGENSSITLMYGNNDIHVSLANNSRISDVNTAGTNTLKLHDLGPSASDAAIFMNVKKNGTVDGDIYIAGIYDMDYHWLDNGGEFDDDIGGVVTIAKTSNVTAANVFSTITNYEGHYLTKANVNSFIEQIASWLSNANDGAGYADVKTALASDEAGQLKDLFWGMNYYYNPEQCVWQQNS